MRRKIFRRPKSRSPKSSLTFVSKTRIKRIIYAFVSEADDRIAGFLLLGPTPATVGTFDMYWIAAHPEFQGRGIAQELDCFAENFVRERGGYLLIAETSSQPSYARTRAFYTKARLFDELARIADYYKPGDDLIIFGKRVCKRGFRAPAEVLNIFAVTRRLHKFRMKFAFSIRM